MGNIQTPAVSLGFIVFVFVWQFLFFRNAFLVGEASVRMLFEYLPWLFIIFVPAITMSVFSQEKSEGTIELLLTHPVKPIEVILAKFFSSWLLIVFSLVFSMPVAFSFSRFGAFDWGAYIAQFLAASFLAASFVSLGVFFSSLLTNGIASLLLTSAVSFFLLIAGSEFITANLPLPIVPIVERLAVSSHVSSMSRGVIDIRDVWYFLSFIIIFLSLTYLFLIRQKFGNRKDCYMKYQIGIALFIATAIVSNVLGARIPGRIDLTSDKRYSLSSSTKNVLSNLSDIVTITFYASSKLPAQLTPVVRDIRDMLRDYQQYGKGNVALLQKDPSNNSQISSEATSRGLREIQFNVIGQEEFQVRTGFVGIVVSYGGKHEAIPFVQDSGDLEYQLTSLIAKLTNKNKKKIAFLSGHGEKNPSIDYGAFYEELQKQFIVETFSFDENTPKVASDTSVLVVAGPSRDIDQKGRDAIAEFLRNGGAGLFFIDSFSINPQMLSATKNTQSFANFFDQYGLSIESNIVYDLRSNETVRIGQGFINLLLPYPFWVRAIPAKTSMVNRLDGVSFPWSASITIQQEKMTEQGLTAQPLLLTTRFAGVQTENIVLNPNQASFSDENLKEHILAVAISGPRQSSSKFAGKMIVVGDSDFITDQFAQNAPQNIAFALSALSYLSEQDTLADIRVKRGDPPRLLFRSDTEPMLIKYGNLAVAVIAPSAFITVYSLKRRALRKQSYLV